MGQKLLPLQLRANFEGVSCFLNRKDDPSFGEIRTKVLSRDHHTCRYCGFHAEKFQQIVSINGDFKNNNLDNLATACIFCMHCQLLALRNTNAKIIFLPEVTQVELNHFVRILFCASTMKREVSDLAKSLYQAFRKRTSVVEEVFGKDASDSLIFAQSLIDINPESQKQQQKALTSLRLLPAKSYYNKQIDYWTNSVITPEKIEAAMQHYSKKMKEANSL
jgi:intracellular multiplication protein IcmJ